MSANATMTVNGQLWGEVTKLEIMHPEPKQQTAPDPDRKLVIKVNGEMLKVTRQEFIGLRDKAMEITGGMNFGGREETVYEWFKDTKTVPLDSSEGIGTTTTTIPWNGTGQWHIEAETTSARPSTTQQIVALLAKKIQAMPADGIDEMQNKLLAEEALDKIARLLDTSDK